MRNISDLSHELVGLVESAIENGMRQDSLLPARSLEVEGMSSPKIRHFLHSLASNFPGGKRSLKYLEIGVYKGSTLISFLGGNEEKFARVVAVDNFLEFDNSGTNFAKLQANLATYSKIDSIRDRLTFLKKSCWDVGQDLDRNMASGGRFNVYFYDGPHDFEDHFKAISMFHKYLANDSVLIVDDYNQQRVRDGTQRGLSELVSRGEFRVLGQWEVLSRWNGDAQGWWDGLGIFVLSRTKKLDFPREL